MKLNFTVEIGEDENLEYEIIEQIASKFYNQIFGNRGDRLSFEEKIEKYIVEKTESVVSNNDFRNSVIEELIIRLADKMETSKQYKVIKKEYEIENSQVINQGLRNIIGDIVKSEMKKAIKSM